ncbi:hypothetical protein D3C81_895560 [compost metagenome]
MACLDPAQRAVPVPRRIGQGDQRPQHGIERGWAGIEAAAVVFGADHEAALVRLPHGIDKAARSRRAVAPARVVAQAGEPTEGGIGIDVVLGRLPALADLLGLVAEEAAGIGRGRAGVGHARMDPAHQRRGAVQVARVARGFVHGQQQQRGPGDVAGGGAGLVGVLEPALAGLVPPARQRCRPCGQRAGAIGVAQPRVAIVAVLPAGLQHGVGNAARFGGTLARDQCDAGQRVVVDEGGVAQRRHQRLTARRGLVAGEEDRAGAGFTPDPLGQYLAAFGQQGLLRRLRLRGRRGECERCRQQQCSGEPAHARWR